MSRFSEILKRRGRKQIAPAVLGKLSPEQVILEPLMTEKSHKSMESEKKYFFKVHSDANKNDVKKSIEALFGVTPLDVKTLIVKSKGRHNRKLVRRAYKKAIVTVPDKIELTA